MTRVAVIGGGLSGLAAAAAALDGGLEVELFEARQRLGGRAGSFVDPQSGEFVDYCQHVAMGCCTRWAEFCRRTGIDRCFQRYRRLWFIGPDGVAYTLCAWPLPAPFHLLPSLLRLGYLSWSERCSAVRAMAALAREDRAAGPRPAARRTTGPPSLDAEPSHETIGAWLRRRGQSERAVAWLWSVLFVSALGESLDRASRDAARHVLREGFMASRRAYELIVPRLSLAEIYDQRLAAWLAGRGARLHRQRRVKSVEVEAGRATALCFEDGTRGAFDYYVVAVPWRNLRRLFAPPVWQAMPELAGVEQIRAAPIAALHLWCDRPLVGLPHAALVGRLGQWIFTKAPLAALSVEGRRRAPSAAAKTGAAVDSQCPGEHYHQVVVSAAHGIHPSARDDVLAQVRRELESIWPTARQARLLRWRLVVEPAAVFSVEPGLDARRPPQRTSLPNVMLAGDWTRTGWPATMESAVRSGYLAVEAILEARRRLA